MKQFTITHILIGTAFCALAAHAIFNRLHTVTVFSAGVVALVLLLATLYRTKNPLVAWLLATPLLCTINIALTRIAVSPRLRRLGSHPRHRRPTGRIPGLPRVRRLGGHPLRTPRRHGNSRHDYFPNRGAAHRVGNSGAAPHLAQSRRRRARALESCLDRITGSSRIRLEQLLPIHPCKSCHPVQKRMAKSRLDFWSFVTGGQFLLARAAEVRYH